MPPSFQNKLEGASRCNPRQNGQKAISDGREKMLKRVLISTTILAVAGSNMAFAQMTEVGAGEGALNIVAWPGYIERGQTERFGVGIGEAGVLCRPGRTEEEEKVWSGGVSDPLPGDAGWPQRPTGGRSRPARPCWAALWFCPRWRRCFTTTSRGIRPAMRRAMRLDFTRNCRCASALKEVPCR